MAQVNKHQTGQRGRTRARRKYETGFSFISFPIIIIVIIIT